MKAFLVVVGLLLILIIGGGLTAMLISNNGGGLLPILTMTTVPDASPVTVLPWKAEQLILLIGFILFNLIGIGVTLAIIFWFVDRGLRRSRVEAGTNAPASTSEVVSAEE